MPAFITKSVRLKGFHAVTLSSLLYLVGLSILGRLVWQFRAIHLWGALGLALGLLLLVVQVRRIREVYNAAYPQAADDDLLKRTMNELIRTFLWGNVIFFLLVMAVFQMSLLYW